MVRLGLIAFILLPGRKWKRLELVRSLNGVEGMGYGSELLSASVRS